MIIFVAAMPLSPLPRRLRYFMLSTNTTYVYYATRHCFSLTMRLRRQRSWHNCDTRRHRRRYFDFSRC